MVYGQPLQVPGDFLPCNPVPRSAPEQRCVLVDRTKSFAIAYLMPWCPTGACSPILCTSKYVFVHHTHRGWLRPPYGGLFWVLEPRDKAFVIDMGFEVECISVNRLKPAHLDLDCPVVSREGRFRFLARLLQTPCLAEKDLFITCLLFLT